LFSWKGDLNPHDAIHYEKLYSYLNIMPLLARHVTYTHSFNYLHDKIANRTSNGI